jgi:hypothetical protein
MAMLDSAIDAASDAISDVTEIALGSLESVGYTVGELSEKRRSRKGLVFLLILAIVAVVGYTAWKRSSRSGAGEGADVYSEPSTSATA